MGCYPFPLPEGPNDDVSKAHRRTTLQQRDTSYVGFFTITTWLHPQLRRRSHLLQDNDATQGRCTLFVLIDIFLGSHNYETGM